MHTSEADFNKPGIYGGNVRVGGRAAVDFVVCFGQGGLFIGVFFDVFFFERTLPHLPLY